MQSVLLSNCGSENAEYCNGAREGAVIGAILEQLQEYLQVSEVGALLRPEAVPSAAMASVANRQRCALLLSLRSAAASGKGELKGCDVCFHPTSAESRRAAELLRSSLASVAPGDVRLLPSPQIPDFRMARCPAVQVRLGCRDCDEDAQWMLEGTGVIAHALARGLAMWLDVPLKSPFAKREAVVRAPGGGLAMRRAPEPRAELLRVLPNGANVTPLHRVGEWQYAEHDGFCGYVLRRYLAKKK
jgi:hypothetical protein